jgi:DNA-binding transcriptional LysR family regulator
MDLTDAVTLRQLRAYAALIEGGTFAAAAERLGVTPPAISAQLRGLEGLVGAPLVSRSDGPPKPTAEGRELLDAMRQIDSLLGRAMHRVEALRAGHTGRVELGVVSTGKYFAPALVALTRKALPDIEIGMTVGNRAQITAAVADRAVDLAIMGRPPRLPPVEAHRLGEHPHLFIASPAHPLAQKAKLDPLELFEETILLREQGSGTRILAERFLDAAGEGRTFQSLEFDSNETIKQAVIAGLGIAFLSVHTIDAELETGRLAVLKVEGTPIVRAWFAVYLQAEPLSACAKQFLDFLLGLHGSFLPQT